MDDEVENQYDHAKQIEDVQEAAHIRAVVPNARRIARLLPPGPGPER
jgi:hypothetical protein